MKILLIGDLHYRSDGISLISERKTKYGIEFLKRIKRRMEEKVDVVIICGDLLDDGENSNAEKEYYEIKKVMEEFLTNKIIYVFGNHDRNIERFYQIFGVNNKFFIKENFLFYVFCDKYHNDLAIRPDEEIENFKKIVRENPGKKVIVIQHNVVYPEIKNTSYPYYNLANSEKIHSLYKENNVFLSISGHYHKGIDLINKDGIYYLTVPAICEEPFKYFIMELKDKLKIKEERLKHQEEIIDYHCHTEFGYCAEDVSMEKVIERCKLFGIKKVHLTEHSGQLYLSKEEYGSAKYWEGVEILRKKREEKKDRVKEYVEKFKSLKTEMAVLGVEVEIDKYGRLTLLEEDKSFFEIIIGGVHYLPDEFFESKRLLLNKFLWCVEKLVENKIKILTHPIRFFYRKNLERPKEIYRNIIKILKEGNVWAELNYHTNNPDPEFFKMCLEEGIKIVFGSDSHNLLEVGDFSKYIEFMKRLK